MIDFIDEVKEDLRRERFEKVFKDYGKYIAAVIAITLGIALGIKIYAGSLNESRMETGDQFNEAVKIAVSESERATGLFNEIYVSGTNGYKELSGIKKAGGLISEGKYTEAVGLYDRIAGDTSLDNGLRDLARLQAVNTLVASKPDDPSINARLTELVEKSVFYFSALELQAVHSMQQEEYDAAKKIFIALAGNLSAPIGMRERADKFVKIMDKQSDAVTARKPEEDTTDKENLEK